MILLPHVADITVSRWLSGVLADDAALRLRFFLLP